MTRTSAANVPADREQRGTTVTTERTGVGLEIEERDATEGPGRPDRRNHAGAVHDHERGIDIATATGGETGERMRSHEGAGYHQIL